MALVTFCKAAGVGDNLIGALTHPVTTAVATVAPAAIAINDHFKQKQEEEAATPKVAGILASLMPSIIQRAQIKEAFIPALIGAGRAAAGLLTRPGVTTAMTGIGNAMTGAQVLGAVTSHKPAPPPTQPAPTAQGTNAQPSTFSPAVAPQSTSQSNSTGANATPARTVTAALISPDGAIDTTQSVVPPAEQPSTRGAVGAPPSPAQLKMKPLSAAPGAPKAFKVSTALDVPKMNKLDTVLNRGSQAAVIGSMALPLYQMWKDQRDDRIQQPVLPANLQVQRDEQTRMASMLPLQPKMPLMDRLGESVRDFGEGAYNEADRQAAKLLAPSTTLDPATHRTPPMSHVL